MHRLFGISFGIVHSEKGSHYCGLPGKSAWSQIRAPLTIKAGGRGLPVDSMRWRSNGRVRCSVYILASSVIVFGRFDGVPINIFISVVRTINHVPMT